MCFFDTQGQAVSAGMQVEDVDASGWWVDHSKGILLADGTATTITFTGTTYEEATANWNTPIYVVYEADEKFMGGMRLIIVKET